MSKLIAAREKDIAFVDALIRSNLIDVPTLIERAKLVADTEAERRKRAIAHLTGYLD